jgi:hypothetical protein
VYTQDGKEHVATDAIYKQWCYIDTASENFYMLKTYQIILDRDRMFKLNLSCDVVNKYITLIYEIGGLEVVDICLKDCSINTASRNGVDNFRITVKHEKALELFKWCFEKAKEDYCENEKEKKEERGEQLCMTNNIM